MSRPPFHEVYHQFEPLIFSFIHKFRLIYDQDEYIQIARIALFEAWSRHDGDHSSFPGYAKSYIRGYLQNAITADRKNQEQNVFTEPSTFALMHTGKSEDDFSMSEVSMLLDSASLSGRERIWVDEYLLNGSSQKDIAGRHGVKPETVKAWRKSALLKLRREFNK
ncbi:sigma-70 family RNA polymerase sigma factor [Alteribacter lacisalsi]|jgi:RNA polymerase sigma factor (sigma-70 family)|nr:sigma-70 family RNA polymerase sigma factor [Alteribacter lacisalsi]